MENLTEIEKAQQLIEAEIKLLKLLATQQKIALSLVWVNGSLQ